MEVMGSCKRCTTPFGTLINEWQKMTGSYYMDADPGRRDDPQEHNDSGRSRIDLQETGVAKAPGRKSDVLKGCLVQALACRKCSDRFAFQCVAAPHRTKDRFKNRIFFKLSKVLFQDTETGKPVSPQIEQGSEPTVGYQTSATPDEAQEHIADNDHDYNAPLTTRRPQEAPAASNPTSPVDTEMPVAQTSPTLIQADDDAARQILAESTWQDAHDKWEYRTRIVLSPASFGHRILPVVDLQRSKAQQVEKQKPMQRELPPLSRPDYRSSEVRPRSNGRGMSPPRSNGHGYHLQRPDSLEAQRADIDRLDGVVHNIQLGIRDLKSMIASVRQEFNARPHRGGDESTTLNLLSETVGQLASKTGEIDGIKFNIATLTHRVKTLEEPPNSKPNQSEQSRSSSSVTYGAPSVSQRPSNIPPTQPLASGPPSNWSAVNSSHHKRKSMSLTDSESSQPDYGSIPKRPRPSNLHHTSSESLESVRPSQHAIIGSAPPPTLAPIRSLHGDSQDSWVPESQRLPSIRGLPPTGRGGRPMSSRGPRPVEDLGTPAWEHDSWNGSQVIDADGYYRPLGGGPPMSPTMAERRGSIIRRGTGGGLHYMDPSFSNKRTRQKPIRNSSGVLIRKDGKPDQRSISSPQNLKKVHARKLQENESSTSPNFPSPLSLAHHGDAGSDEQGSGSSGEVSQYASPTQSEFQEKETETDRGHNASHGAIMKQMFPHGVADEAERMNHAAHLFQPREGQQRSTTVQSRGDMIRNDVHHQQQQEDERRESNDSEESITKDVDAMDTDQPAGAAQMLPPPPRKDSARQVSPAASGSVYTPGESVEASTLASEYTRTQAEGTDNSGDVQRGSKEAVETPENSLYAPPSNEDSSVVDTPSTDVSMVNVVPESQVTSVAATASTA